MRINRNNLFASILAFLIIVDLLISLNLNQLYIRAILAFLFITIVPGLLIMLIMKVREMGFWEYIVYIVGLSVSFIMFVGLAINWILPILNITNKPLSLWPILISFNIILIIMGIIAFRRNKDLKLEIKPIKLDFLNRIFFIIPILFPFMAVIGAFILNNNGPNTMTMVLLGGIALYFFAVVLFRKKLNENIYPWSIWLMSVSIILSSSLRSWFVSGIDTNLEYSIFQLTKEYAYWSINNIDHVYNMMLSISIFPTFISGMVNINDHLIFKILIPILFCILPIIVYLISTKYFSKLISFIAAVFFISQEGFTRWAAIPIRQEIAFLFFGLLVLILIDDKEKLITRKTLLILISFSIIVSHYSTMYLTLFLIILFFLTKLFFGKFVNKKTKTKEESNVISFGFIILLLTVSFLWYSQVTDTSHGLLVFIEKSTKNLDNIFEEETQAEGRSLLEQFNIFSKQDKKIDVLKEYINESKKAYNLSIYSVYPSADKYTVQPKSSIIMPYNINSKVAYPTFLGGEIIKKLMKVLVIIGFFYFVIKNRKDVKKATYWTLVVSSMAIFLIVITLPFATISYDLIRTSQQILIIQAPMAVIGSIFLLKFFKNEKIVIISALIFLGYFIFVNGLTDQILGGTNPSLRLNNYGSEYNLYYVHASEVDSAKWLTEVNKNKKVVNIDSYANTKLDLENNYDEGIYLVKDVLPNTIQRGSYVYSSYSNTINKIGFKPLNGHLISYNFPQDFLNANKNKIYNNGGSELFK